MNNSVLYIWITMLCLVGSGCGDFLEEYSQDQVYAASWEDLDEVLIGNGYMKTEVPTDQKEWYYPYLFLMDDDAEELLTAASSGGVSSSTPVGYWRSAATWQQNPFVLSFASQYSEFDDKSVRKLYAHIAYVNTIINYLDEFPNDPVDEKMRIRGEGQFLRAAYYLMVSNLYGWAYDAKNKGTDLSVPLKTYEWVVEDHFARAMVGEVYRLIVEDLNGAVRDLEGVVQKNFYLANQLAALTLLSRVYLYMEDYDNVIAQCDSALATGCPLADLNDYNVAPELTLKERDYFYDESNPEIVFTMGYAFVQSYFVPENMTTNGGGQYSASPSLINEFLLDDSSVKDLRLNCFFKPHATAAGRYGVCKNYEAYYLTKAPRVFETFLIRTAEVYLNKAEAQAMKGNLAGAVATLQPFLENRYATGMLPAIASLEEEELVKFIRSQRRRELCFEGHRWPDLKRYAVHSKYPENKAIEHTIYTPRNNSGGDNAGKYVLGEYGKDAGWILPFPTTEMTYNEGLIENPERPERQLVSQTQNQE